MVEQVCRRGEENEQSRRYAARKCKESKQLIINLNRKPVKITSPGYKKIKLPSKNDARKADEECLQLYGLVKKALKELKN